MKMIALYVLKKSILVSLIMGCLLVQSQPPIDKDKIWNDFMVLTHSFGISVDLKNYKKAEKKLETLKSMMNEYSFLAEKVTDVNCIENYKLYLEQKKLTDDDSIVS